VYEGMRYMLHAVLLGESLHLSTHCKAHHGLWGKKGWGADILIRRFLVSPYNLLHAYALGGIRTLSGIHMYWLLAYGPESMMFWSIKAVCHFSNFC
jgi:hypothetical protein